MHCRKARAEISRLGRKDERGLNPGLFEHLRLCPECQREWGRHAALLGLLRASEPLPAFNDILSGVMMRLREGRRPRSQSWQWAAAAAIALAALLLGYFLGLRSASPAGNTEGQAATYREALSGMPSGSVELAALDSSNSGATAYTAEAKR